MHPASTGTKKWSRFVNIGSFAPLACADMPPHALLPTNDEFWEHGVRLYSLYEVDFAGASMQQYRNNRGSSKAFPVCEIIWNVKTSEDSWSATSIAVREVYFILGACSETRELRALTLQQGIDSGQFSSRLGGRLDLSDTIRTHMSSSSSPL